MKGIILNDLWTLYYVFMFGLIFTGFVFLNLILTFRMHYFYKNNTDPIKAVKYKSKEELLKEDYLERERDNVYNQPLI